MAHLIKPLVAALLLAGPGLGQQQVNDPNFSSRVEDATFTKCIRASASTRRTETSIPALAGTAIHSVDGI